VKSQADQEFTSVAMPNAREMAAATIRITNVKSWQASQRKICFHDTEHSKKD
jgi:hypothetical protein